ncbi:hypothetical protein [Bartonella sp. TP]|uniref:hypothetical protein n=1 Tax=Bartonella sp. TP TaxID=3057550 RepID=UPI0025AF1A28|nr:hypothetical protein [Bartonella sp. TP]WJW79990.1 hypothetical protein QVL57_05685 [Bartonella sp. TP]
MPFTSALKMRIYGEEVDPDVDEKLEKLTDRFKLSDREINDWQIAINMGFNGVDLVFSTEGMV